MLTDSLPHDGVEVESGAPIRAAYYKTLITCFLVPSSRSQCFITTGIPMQKCDYVYNIIFIFAIKYQLSGLSNNNLHY